MANVARIYNDNVGVVSNLAQTPPPRPLTARVSPDFAQELCQRTGRNPAVRRFSHAMPLVI